MPEPVSEKKVEKPPSLLVLESSAGRPSGYSGDRRKHVKRLRKISEGKGAYVQSMLERVKLPYALISAENRDTGTWTLLTACITDLDTGLTDVQGDDFTHVDRDDVGRWGFGQRRGATTSSRRGLLSLATGSPALKDACPNQPTSGPFSTVLGYPTL